MSGALRFLEPSSDRRAQRDGLGALWNAVLERLPPSDRAALGRVRVGALDTSDDAVPFAYTNEGDESVNLTLELKPDQLELNLVGWKQEQSEALKNWLQSVPGEDAINRLRKYEVVAFAREAYKKTPTSAPWWQDESVVELGSCSAEEFNAGWIAGRMIGLRGSPKEVKPAFHIRRSWPRDAATETGDAPLDEIAGEVQRLLPILREIWARG